MNSRLCAGTMEVDGNVACSEPNMMYECDLRSQHESPPRARSSPPLRSNWPPIGTSSHSFSPRAESPEPFVSWPDVTEPVTPAALPALSQPELDFSPSHTEARVAHPSTGIAECSTPRTSPRPLRPETPGTSLGDSRDPSRPPAAAVAVGPAAMREWWGECCRQAASLPLLQDPPGSGRIP